MKILLTLPMVLLLSNVLSCSKTAAINDSSMANLNIVEPSNLNTAVSPENISPLNPPRLVLKNCIKKDGLLVPPSDKEYISETTLDLMQTKNGKKVEVTQSLYSFGYENAWTYSQDLRCKDGDPAYLTGKFATPWYTQSSINDKVFMYSIFAKEVRIPPPSNSDSGEERFMYNIRDDDGDGIFETLSHGGDNFVPSWVLK